MCDDIGLDAIEIGSALAVASEAGRMKRGDWESAAELLMQIEKGTELGVALGNGVVSTAKAFGLRRVPSFKGQAIPGHDPRSVKGTGVTYLTSPMGADHTAGLTYRIPRAKERQVENSLRFQVQAATAESFGRPGNSTDQSIRRPSYYRKAEGLWYSRKRLEEDRLLCVQGCR